MSTANIVSVVEIAFLVPQIGAPTAPSTFWPTSFVGYVAAIGVVLGWGMMLQRFKDLEKRTAHVIAPEQAKKLIEEFEEMAADVRMLKTTMYGDERSPLRDGIAKDVHEVLGKVLQIEKRNDLIDAMEARAKGAAQAGHEERHQSRRREDRLLRGEEVRERDRGEENR